MPRHVRHASRPIAAAFRREREVYAPVRQYTLDCPEGTGFATVSPLGCADTFLVKQLATTGSPAPGSLLVGLAQFGGTTRSVIPLAPSGLGSSSRSVASASELNIAAPAAPVGTYLAFFRDSSTELTIKSLDGNGDITETLHTGLTIPAGSITIGRTEISRIAGDGTVPDDSFTFYTGSKLYVVNISTGAFTEIFDGGVTEAVSRGGVLYDPTLGKLFIMTAFEVSAIEFFSARMRSVNTDGSSLTLLNTDTRTFPEWYQGTGAQRATTVYEADRAFQFVATSPGTSWVGCVEFPFDGSSVVDRTGDTPVSTVVLDAVFSAGAGYHAALASSQTVFQAALMPTTSGDAATLGWPSSTFFPGAGSSAGASLINGDIVLWPVLDTGGGSDVFILRTEKDTPATTSSLVQVSSATTGPVTPFAVMATS